MSSFLEKFFLRFNITYLERKQKIWLAIKLVLLVFDLVVLSWSLYGILDYYLHPVSEVNFNYSALERLHNKRAPQDLIVLNQALIQRGAGAYEAYFEVKNPNANWLIKELVYNVDLMQDGKVYVRKSAKNFFEPQSQKKLIILGLESKNIIHPELKLSFSPLQWEKAFNYPKLNLKPIIDEKLQIQEDKTIYSGVIHNTSTLLLKEIEINVFLYDTSRVIALNQTFLRDLKPDENREFLVFWPQKLAGQRVETELEINPFNIKAPFTEEDSDQYEWPEY